MTDAAPNVGGCSRRFGLRRDPTAGAKALRAAVVTGHVDRHTASLHRNHILYYPVPANELFELLQK